MVIGFNFPAIWLTVESNREIGSEDANAVLNAKRLPADDLIDSSLLNGS